MVKNRIKDLKVGKSKEDVLVLDTFNRKFKASCF